MKKSIIIDGHEIFEGTILGYPGIDYSNLPEDFLGNERGRLKFGFNEDMGIWYVVLIDINEFESYPIEQLDDISKLIPIS